MVGTAEGWPHATSALAHARASHRDAWLAKSQQGTAGNHRGVGSESLLACWEAESCSCTWKRAAALKEELLTCACLLEGHLGKASFTKPSFFQF